MRLLRAGVHFYLVGIIILTLGISLAIISMLGTSPYDALLVGLFRSFGLTIGTWEVVVGTVMILGNALAEKKRPEYFAFITSVITGIGIDSWLFILRLFIVPDAWLGQWICLVLSIIFTGLGIAIYLQSEVAPNPMDRSMLVVSNLTGWNVTYSRALINVILVITAFFFGGAIGIGTLLNAVLTGVIIGYLLPYVSRLRKISLKKLEDPEKRIAEGK